MKLFLVVAIFCLYTTGLSLASLVGYTAKGTCVYVTDFQTAQQIPHQISGIYGDFSALAVSPIDGKLFAVTNVRQDFYKIDVLSDTAQYIGRINCPGDMQNLSFASDGTLYGFSTCTTLVKIDTVTANTIVIGDTIARTIVPYAGGFAIDATGQGVAYVMDGYSWTFMHVNLTNASGHRIGNYMPQFEFFGLDYSATGTLFAWSNKTLYRIDNSTFVPSIQQTVYYSGDAFTLIPEPASLLLLAFGGILAIRKKQPGI